MSLYQLKLFVSGNTPRSQQAFQHLHTICEEMLHGEYDIQVIDVLDHPDQAEQAGVLATPTAIKTCPGVVARVVGDLSDKMRVLEALGLPHP